jgi:carbon storage regulator
MLVLSRKKNESIRIGENIEITVLEVRGDRVRIGITAPQEVRVMRSELLTPTSVETSRVTRSAGANAVVLVAEEPRHDDTLSSETARTQTPRHGSRRPR